MKQQVYVVELSVPDDVVKCEGFASLSDARRFAWDLLVESVEEKELWNDSKEELDAFREFLKEDDLDGALDMWRESLGYQEDLSVKEVRVNQASMAPRTRVVPANELDKGLRARDYTREPGEFSKEAYLNLAVSRSLESESRQEALLSALHILTAHCYATAVDKGWWEKYEGAPSKWLPEIVSSKIALMHSELSEALEELRNRKDMGLKPYFSISRKGALDKSIYELDVERGLAEGAKPEGMAAELADAVIRICDLAAWLNLDLAQALLWKMKYNNTRSHKHGGKNV